MEINKKLQYRLLEKNIRYSIIDGMCFSVMMGATTPYLGLYILRLKGPFELVNLITAVQPIVLCIFTLLGTAYANSFQKKKALLMPPSIAIRLSILVIAFIPFLPIAWHAWSFFLIWALANIPWAYTGLTWSPMICHIVPEERRNLFFGVRNALTGITTLLGTFLTGLALSKFEFYTAFTIIFTVSFLFTAISYYYLDKHIEPLVLETGETKDRIRSGNARLIELDWAGNLKPFHDPTYGPIFTLCCLTVFIFHIGYTMAAPLYILRQIKQLGFDNAAVSTIATITGVTALIGSYLGGYASHKWGYRYVLLFSTSLALISPVLWATTQNQLTLILASMLWGLAGNAYMICYSFMVLSISPEQDRSRFVGVTTVIGNLAGALGPVIGMLLVKVPVINIQGALIAASAIMLAGVLLSCKMVKESTI